MPAPVISMDGSSNIHKRPRPELNRIPVERSPGRYRTHSG